MGLISGEIAGNQLESHGVSINQDTPIAGSFITENPTGVIWTIADFIIIDYPI